MDERRSAEGVEHLQAAARELLGAARAFLDVIEDVVEDSDRLSAAADTVSDLVRNGLGLVGGRDDPHPGPSRTADWWDEPFPSEPAAEPAAETAQEPSAEPSPAAKKAPVRKKPSASAAKKAAPARAPSRVRRIAVD